MSIELFVLFMTATVTFAVMPGPAILYVVAATLSGGRAAGFRASAGVHLGGYVHVFAAVAGLVVLLQAVSALYTGLKLAGALYLIWLGISLLRHSEEKPETTLPRRHTVSIRQSMIVEILNPKAALFYLAFLPQFTTPEAALSVPMQLLLFGVIVNIVFSIADLFFVLAADGVNRHIAQSRAVLWVRRTGAAILIGLGFNLALSRT